jgi:hypothetical protein
VHAGRFKNIVVHVSLMQILSTSINKFEGYDKHEITFKATWTSSHVNDGITGTYGIGTNGMWQEKH